MLYKQTTWKQLTYLHIHYHNMDTVGRSKKGHGTSSFWFKRMRSMTKRNGSVGIISSGKKVLASINESIKHLVSFFSFDNIYKL